MANALSPDQVANQVLDELFEGARRQLLPSSQGCGTFMLAEALSVLAEHWSALNDTTKNRVRRYLKVTEAEDGTASIGLL